MRPDTFENLTPEEIEQTIRRYDQLVAMVDMLLPRYRCAVDGAELHSNGQVSFPTESYDGDSGSAVTLPLTAFCGFADWDTFVAAANNKRKADEAAEAKRRALIERQQREAAEAADRRTYEALKAKYG